MITAYLVEKGGRLTLQDIKAGEPIPPGSIWLDVKEPDDTERDYIERLLHEDMPEEEELDDLENSSRYQVAGDGVHILSLFPQKRGDKTIAVNMQFILRKNILVSFREDDISITRLMRANIRRHVVSKLDSPLDVLINLHDQKVEQLSDLIEEAYATLEETAEHVMDDEHVTETLRRLVQLEDRNSQILLALNDTRRALRFIRTTLAAQLDAEQTDTIAEVLTDIESILPHTSFLSNKINFQLEASMGHTNNKQNKIIKIFSVASVVFMPPTWIASVYGMNFKFIPELEWLFGYPFALGLMALSAVCTYLFFKKKGWL